MYKSLFAFALTFSAVAFASEGNLLTRRQRKSAEKEAKFKLEISAQEQQAQAIRTAEGNSPTQRHAEIAAHEILGNRKKDRK